MERTYRKPASGTVKTGPDARREGKYLLSGLARCGGCGGQIGVRGGEYRMYGCIPAAKRGTCENRFCQRVDVVERSVLATVQQTLLTPTRLATAVRFGMERLRERLGETADQRPSLERERVSLSRRIERWVAAIGDGRGPAALVAQIQGAEERVKAIEAELARLAAMPALLQVDLKRLQAAVEVRLTRFVELLTGDIPQARRVLKDLLAEPITMTPVTLAPGEQTYAFTGQLNCGALLQGTVIADAVSAKQDGDLRYGDLLVPFVGRIDD